MPAKFKPDYRIYKRYYTNVKHLYRRRDVVVYTGLTLSFLAIAFFGFFALKPTITTIASLMKEIKVKRELDQKLEERLETLRLAQKNYALASESKPLVDEALPEKPYLSQLVYQIEGLSQQLGLEITSLSFDSIILLDQKTSTQSKKIAGPEKIDFSVGLLGEYESLLKYLESIEELRRLIKVETFGFTQEEKEERLSIKLTISGGAFFY